MFPANWTKNAPRRPEKIAPGVEFVSRLPNAAAMLKDEAASNAGNVGWARLKAISVGIPVSLIRNATR